MTRLSLPFPRRLALLLAVLGLALTAGTATAAASSLVRVQDDAAIFTGVPDEPDNVTVTHVNGMIRFDEDASRMAAADPCVLSNSGYRVECPDTGIDKLEVTTSPLMGSDVRIRTALPATITGGAADDTLIGGPGADTIDGGGGLDEIGGGGGADVIHATPLTLVTYSDQIGPGQTLLPRKNGVTVRPGVKGASGARGEHDTIDKDTGQLEGTSGNDTFDVRDGIAQAITCGAGTDTVSADPRDQVETDCEKVTVAPIRGEAKMTIPALAFPFASKTSAGRSDVTVLPTLPVVQNAAVVHVTCPPPVGLLAADGPGCAGRVRIAHGSTTLATPRVTVGRGRTVTVKVPLSSSLRSAARRSGISLTATALPTLGHVQRVLHFKVKG